MKTAPLFLLATALCLQNCATIVGGSRYNASVIVKDHTKAKISFEGIPRGTGTAFLKIGRSHADRVVFTVQEEGCREQVYQFTDRTFRGWALVGTIVWWTGLVNGVPLPFGLVLDAATGAFWKPTVDDISVVKLDYKNFTYVLNYTGCN